MRQQTQQCPVTTPLSPTTRTYSPIRHPLGGGAAPPGGFSGGGGGGDGFRGVGDAAPYVGGCPLT